MVELRSARFPGFDFVDFIDWPWCSNTSLLKATGSRHCAVPPRFPLLQLAGLSSKPSTGIWHLMAGEYSHMKAQHLHPNSGQLYIATPASKLPRGWASTIFVATSQPGFLLGPVLLPLRVWVPEHSPVHLHRFSIFKCASQESGPQSQAHQDITENNLTCDSPDYQSQIREPFFALWKFLL